MSDNTKLSRGVQFRRQLARTPRPEVDHNGRPVTKMTYTYDEHGMLVGAKAADAESAE